MLMILHDNRSLNIVICFVLTLFLQTGPKGVIQDYRRYKQLETEQRKEKEKEMKLLAEKFSVSCQSSVSCFFFTKFRTP